MSVSIEEEEFLLVIHVHCIVLRIETVHICPCNIQNKFEIKWLRQKTSMLSLVVTTREIFKNSSPRWTLRAGQWCITGEGESILFLPNQLKV